MTTAGMDAGETIGTSFLERNREAKPSRFNDSKISSAGARGQERGEGDFKIITLKFPGTTEGAEDQESVQKILAGRFVTG